MSGMAVRKDARLTPLVERLRRDLGSGYFREVPHWDDDMLAAGPGRPDDPRVLVHVAVQLAGEGLYHECETPTEDSYQMGG